MVRWIIFVVTWFGLYYDVRDEKNIRIVGERGENEKKEGARNGLESEGKRGQGKRRGVGRKVGGERSRVNQKFGGR